LIVILKQGLTFLKTPINAAAKNMGKNKKMLNSDTAVQECDATAVRPGLMMRET